MKKDKWVWMPHAGHLIVGHDCRFHLNTWVGNFIVSTVGEYWPDEPIREINAQSRGVVLVGRGDERRADYMKKIGYEEIGCNRKYETMVFPAMKSSDACCPYTAKSWSELDTSGYNTADDAMRGHYKMCRKWANKK